MRPDAAAPWTDDMLRTLPRVGLFVAIALLVALLIGGYEPWQLVIVIAMGVGVLAAVIRITLAGVPKSVPLPMFLGAVMVFQCLGAAAAGGAMTSIFVILAPTAVLAALLLRPDVWRRLMVVPVVGVVAIAAIQLTGVELVPRALDARVPESHPVLIVTTTLVTLVAVIVGGFLGRRAQEASLAATEQAAAVEAELAEALAERNRHLVGLSGAIAHELKNPLSAIQGLSKLMESQATGDDARQTKRLRVLVEESERMARILEEFLNFSRPITDLTVAPTPIGPLLRNVAAIHEGLADDRGVTLAVRVEGDGPTVDCDPRKIKQVLLNLVQNALEVAPEGSTVTLSAAAADGEALVRVDDEGPGLDDALEGRAFDPGVTTKGGGTGLGLTIARSIAQQHEGTLALSNRAEGGCRAELGLPAGTDPA